MTLLKCNSHAILTFYKRFPSIKNTALPLSSGLPLKQKKLSKTLLTSAYERVAIGFWQIMLAKMTSSVLMKITFFYITKDSQEEWPRMQKDEIARDLTLRIIRYFEDNKKLKDMNYG